MSTIPASHNHNTKITPKTNETSAPSKAKKTGKGAKFDALSFIKNLALIGGLGFGIVSLLNSSLFKAADPNNYLKVAANANPFYYPTFGTPQSPIGGTPPDVVPSVSPTTLPSIPFGGNPVYNPRNILTGALTNLFPWNTTTPPFVSQ